MPRSLTACLPALPLAFLPLLAPGIAAASDGAIWTATHIGDTGYLPLENLRSFYKLIPKPTGSSNSICTVGNPDISISFGPGKRDITIGRIRCRLTHPLQRDSSGELLISKTDMVKLIDPILRPTYIPNRQTVQTVVIDPGHGGRDVGTQTPYAREADMTLLLARQLQEELVRKGYEAILTRGQNQYLSDQQRLECANRASNPIFISLHLNSGRSDIRGIETYSLAPALPGEPPCPGNTHDSANAALSFALHAALIAGTGAHDGACRRVRYSLLSSLHCPAALVELGYATHKEEGALLASEEYRAKLAAALAQGIEAFAHAIRPEATLKPQAEAASDTPPSTYTAAPLPPFPEPKASKTNRASGKNANKRPAPRRESAKTRTRRNNRR